MNPDHTHTFFSFVKNGNFVGCILTNEPDPFLALIMTHRLGINPGGEIFYTNFTMEPHMDIMNAPLNKLLSKADLDKLNISWRKNDKEC
jgi:hypothetical protein